MTATLEGVSGQQHAPARFELQMFIKDAFGNKMFNKK